MKKLLIIILTACTMLEPLMAQRVQTQVGVSPTSSPIADQFTHIVLKTQTGNATVTFTIPNGMTQHQITWKVGPATTALTTSVYGSTTGASFAPIGTSTSLGGTISGTGTYSIIRVVYSGYDGSGDIDADYYGGASTSAMLAMNAVFAQLGARTMAGSVPVTMPVDPAPMPIYQYGKFNVDATLRDSLGNKAGVPGNPLPVSVPQVQNRCATDIPESTAISQTSSTRWITGRPGMRIIICGVRLVAAAAEITSEWEGTGSACGTATIARSGSTTAANGESFAANGGYSSFANPYMTLPGNDWCVGQSGGSRVSGKVLWLYVQDKL